MDDRTLLEAFYILAAGIDRAAGPEPAFAYPGMPRYGAVASRIRALAKPVEPLTSTQPGRPGKDNPEDAEDRANKTAGYVLDLVEFARSDYMPALREGEVLIKTLNEPPVRHTVSTFLSIPEDLKALVRAAHAVAQAALDDTDNPAQYFADVKRSVVAMITELTELKHNAPNLLRACGIEER